MRLWIAISLLAGLGSSPAVRADLPADSLARVAPASAGFFVEMRGAADLLTAMAEPQLWTALAEIAGQPATAEDAVVWRQRVARTVRMSPAEAIGTLFSRQVAFLGEGLGRSQDAIILCRPAGGAKPLIDRWSPRPVEEAGAGVYQLLGPVGVGARGDLLAFGDLAPGGMLRTLWALPADAPRLADDATFRRLLARVSDRSSGLLFARLSSGVAARTASRPATSRPSTDARAPADLPGPFRDCDAILLALERASSRLDVTAVGTTRGWEARGAGRAPSRLLRELPASTLLALETPIDTGALQRQLALAASSGPLRALAQSTETLAGVIASLGDEVCVAVGAPPRDPGVDAPPFPAVALLCRVKDAERVDGEIDRVVGEWSAVANIYLLSQSRPSLPAIDEHEFSGARVRVLDLSSLLESGMREVLAPRLSWTLDDGTLIAATSDDWLEEILAARRSSSAPRMRLPDPPNGASAERVSTRLVAQTDLIARLGEAWLAHMQRTAPDVLEVSWWRARQPDAGRVRLGVDGVQDEALRALRVESVAPGTPAEGRIRPGDVIIGCNGQRFATSQPSDELRRALVDRPHPSRFDVLVQRGEGRNVVSLPIPFVDPVQSLRRVIAVGGLARRVVYQQLDDDAQGPRAVLTIELEPVRRPAVTTQSATATSAGSSASP